MASKDKGFVNLARRALLLESCREEYGQTCSHTTGSGSGKPPGLTHRHWDWVHEIKIKLGYLKKSLQCLFNELVKLFICEILKGVITSCVCISQAVSFSRIHLDFGPLSRSTSSLLKIYFLFL